MKNLKVIFAIFYLISLFSCNNGTAQDTTVVVPPAAKLSNEKIQVAILLDASNSMDGLIEQAKSRLWNIINTLTTLKYEGKEPGIEIALYMYGNDGLSVSTNFIRQVTPFTSDLDLISEKLFAITTNGGSEYCGAVIEQAVKKLDWGRERNNMKLIYIAGNEPFTQGSISYKEAISEAVSKDIYINTIHCGSCLEGEKGSWKDGADRGKGKYFCINSNEKVLYVVTPYDEQINNCNVRLNKTYIYYGSSGYSSFTNQSAQDMNAVSISTANATERVVSKSKSVYNNMSWDLVDKISADSTYIKNIDVKTLPKEYQNLNKEQLQDEIDKKTKERDDIQKEISQLSKKRMDYIASQTKTSNTQDDFGNAVNTSIMEVAKIKGYKVIGN
jgi:hypothetical protein